MRQERGEDETCKGRRAKGWGGRMKRARCAEHESSAACGEQCITIEIPEKNSEAFKALKAFKCGR